MDLIAFVTIIMVAHCNLHGLARECQQTKDQVLQQTSAWKLDHQFLLEWTVVVQVFWRQWLDQM